MNLQNKYHHYEKRGALKQHLVFSHVNVLSNLFSAQPSKSHYTHYQDCYNLLQTKSLVL